MKNTREKCIRKYKTSSKECCKALDEENETISTLLLEAIFGKGCWVERHARNNLSLVYPFYTLDENGNKIFYNLGITGNNNEFYFRFEQWQKGGNFARKRYEAELIKQICLEIAERNKDYFKFLNISKRDYNSYKIFRVYINKEHTPEDTCKILEVLFLAGI